MLDQAQRLRQLVAQMENSSINKKTMQKEQINTKIITVTSGKGGVGKSNFVVNLSLELQRLNKKVLIFDADIGMGNDDILMGFYPKHSVIDVIFNNKSIEDVLLEGPYGIKLLPGGSAINKLVGLTDDQKEIFLSKLEALKEYDYIIMDTGAGINSDILSFIACCDNLIVIVTPEPTALMDAYSVIKAIKHYDIKYIDNIKVVVNKVANSKEGINIFNTFSSTAKKFLNIPLDYLGYVQEDEKVSKSVKLQEPFILKFPNSIASENIRSIAKNIFGNSHKNGKIGITGLFKKIFTIFS